MPRVFQGLGLGLWHWPLVNAVLGIIGGGGVISPPSGIIVQNTETITWTDWRGRERRTVVERKVR